MLSNSEISTESPKVRIRRSDLPAGFSIIIIEDDSSAPLDPDEVKQRLFSKMVSVANTGHFVGEVAPIELRLPTSLAVTVPGHVLHWFCPSRVRVKVISDYPLSISGNDVLSLISGSQ